MHGGPPMAQQAQCNKQVPHMLLLSRACAQISQVIAPATLAVFALNLSHISFLDMATLGFGYFLAEKLEPGNLFWAFIATLVAAVYYDYGARMHCACYAQQQ